MTNKQLIPMPVQIWSVIPGINTQGSQPAFQAQAWTQVTIVKETSGVVLMSTDPVSNAGGKGMRLPEDIPLTFILGPGSTLFFITTTSAAAGIPSAERVSIVAQKIPEEYLKDVIKGWGC